MPNQFLGIHVIDWFGSLKTKVIFINNNHSLLPKKHTFFLFIEQYFLFKTFKITFKTFRITNYTMKEISLNKNKYQYDKGR